MRNGFEIKNLDRIGIIGVGLLGGSIGHALRAEGFNGTRVGIGRRRSSLNKALACEAVDEVTCDPVSGVAGAQLVIICTPISRFEPLFQTIAGALPAGTYVTDVASTKTEVCRLAGRLLPKSVHFVGAHPIAGSEKTGVEYARADLFEQALCLLTPTPRTPAAAVRWIRGFWETLGCRTMTLGPRRHDTLLAQVSHLPHAVATALVLLSRRDSAIDLAGPGFADATRIASGNADLWVDVFHTNRPAMIKAVDRLIAELTRFRGYLRGDDRRAIRKWLEAGKKNRDEWIARRYRGKGLNP